MNPTAQVELGNELPFSNEQMYDEELSTTASQESFAKPKEFRIPTVYCFHTVDGTMTPMIGGPHDPAKKTPKGFRVPSGYVCGKDHVLRPIRTGVVDELTNGTSQDPPASDATSANSKKRKRRTAAEMAEARKIEEARRAEKLKEKARAQLVKDEQKAAKALLKDAKQQARSASASTPRFIWSEEAVVDLLRMIQHLRNELTIKEASMHGFIPWIRFLRDNEDVKLEYDGLKTVPIDTINRKYKALTQTFKEIRDKCSQTGGGGLHDQLAYHNMSHEVYDMLAELSVSNNAANAVGGINSSQSRVAARGCLHKPPSFVIQTASDDGGDGEDGSQADESVEVPLTPSPGLFTRSRSRQSDAPSSTGGASSSTSGPKSAKSSFQDTINSLLMIQKEMHASQLAMQQQMVEMQMRSNEKTLEALVTANERAEKRDERTEQRNTLMTSVLLSHLGDNKNVTLNVNASDAEDFLKGNQHQGPSGSHTSIGRLPPTR